MRKIIFSLLLVAGSVCAQPVLHYTPFGATLVNQPDAASVSALLSVTAIQPLSAAELSGALDGSFNFYDRSLPVISVTAPDANSHARDPGCLHVTSGTHKGYWVWYSGVRLDYTWRIQLAYSPDLSTWTTYGTVINTNTVTTPGAAGYWRSFSVFSASPYYDATRDELYLFVSGVSGAAGINGTDQSQKTGVFWCPAAADWTAAASYQVCYSDQPALQVLPNTWETNSIQGVYAVSSPLLISNQYIIAFSTAITNNPSLPNTRTYKIGFARSSGLTNTWIHINTNAPAVDFSAQNIQTEEPSLFRLRGGTIAMTGDSLDGNIWMASSTNNFGTNGWSYVGPIAGKSLTTWHSGGMASCYTWQEPTGELLIFYGGSTQLNVGTFPSIGMATMTLGYNNVINAGQLTVNNALAVKTNLIVGNFAGSVTGAGSIAGGYVPTVSGAWSIGIGDMPSAIGKASAAFCKGQANNQYSSAIGEAAIASANSAHALGWGTAAGTASIVIGATYQGGGPAVTDAETVTLAGTRVEVMNGSLVVSNGTTYPSLSGFPTNLVVNGANYTNWTICCTNGNLIAVKTNTAGANSWTVKHLAP